METRSPAKPSTARTAISDHCTKLCTFFWSCKISYRQYYINNQVSEHSSSKHTGVWDIIVAQTLYPACDFFRNRITLGTNVATRPIAMFQIWGDVPNRALTLGTFSTSWVLLTSGKFLWAAWFWLTFQKHSRNLLGLEYTKRLWPPIFLSKYSQL